MVLTGSFELTWIEFPEAEDPFEHELLIQPGFVEEQVDQEDADHE
jgi:hypothetical protein